MTRRDRILRAAGLVLFALAVWLVLAAPPPAPPDRLSTASPMRGAP